MSLINYVIKMDNGSPVDHPMPVENFRLSFEEKIKKADINLSFIESKGWAPFQHIDKPEETSRTSVEENGYTLGNNGWVTPSYSIVNKSEDQIDLDTIKSESKDKIRKAYKVSIDQNVTANGVDYNGGSDSAIKLKAAMDLAEANGDSNVTFFDAQNEANALSLADAKSVVLQIWADYQSKLSMKQSLFVSIDAATNLSEVDAVSAPDEWINLLENIDV
jgi:hypothetical protein